MKQYFTHYENWEDYKAGMYNMNDILDKNIKVFEAVILLSEPIEFYSVMKQVRENWPVSFKVNMTNKSQNRRAWLGAAACMYKCNCPEYLTRIAWGLLNKDVQDKANKIAEKIITQYERENIKLHKDLGTKMLF